VKKLLILLSGLCFALPAYAAANNISVFLEDLTWQEVVENIDKGTNIILVPSGGTEQNGPHIAIGKHNWIVRHTSAEIAKKLGNALVAPVIAYVPEGKISPPEGNMRFSGTISLREEGFAMLLEDAARSFKQAGFRTICFIGDNGANQKIQSDIAQKLSVEWQKEGITVLHVSDYYANNGSEQWVASTLPMTKEPAAHGGFMDTAETMAINSSAIRLGKLKPYDAKDFEATGAMGSPVDANANYGKQLLLFKINAAVAQIQKHLPKN
jgi:creatinine amidohydrolase/Fe(II)-dependent formamide hydrolase-like protein